MTPVDEERLRGLLHASRMDCLIRGHGWDVADALTAFRQAGVVEPTPEEDQPLNAATMATLANLRIATSTALADVIDMASRCDPGSGLHTRLTGLARTLDVLAVADRLHREPGAKGQRTSGHHDTRSAAAKQWRTPDGT